MRLGRKMFIVGEALIPVVQIRRISAGRKPVLHGCHLTAIAVSATTAIRRVPTLSISRTRRLHFFVSLLTETTSSSIWSRATTPGVDNDRFPRAPGKGTNTLSYFYHL